MKKYSCYLNFDTYAVHRIPVKKYLALCEKFPEVDSDWQRQVNYNAFLEIVKTYPIVLHIDNIGEFLS